MKYQGNGWKNKITIPKEYTPHPTDKELLRKKKNTEFSEFYNQILTKNNKSVSFTNFNLTVRIFFNFI